MSRFQAFGAWLAPRLVRWRVAIVAVWLMVLLAAGSQVGGLSKLVSEDYGATSSGSWRANAVLKEQFGLNAVTELGLIFERAEGVSDAGFTAYREAVVEAVRAEPDVAETRPIPIADRPGLGLEHVRLQPTLDDPASVEAVTKIKRRLAAIEKPQGLEAHLMGRPVVMEELEALSSREIHRIERISLVISLGVLVLVFGSLVSALLPLAVGLAGIVTTLGTITALGGLIPVMGMTRLITGIVAVAIGIDYALFLVSRYREERARGESIEGALSLALGRTGEAVVFSGAIMILSVAALAIPDYSGTRAIAGAIALVVTVCVLASMTLLPALLVLLDRALGWPKLLARLRWGHSEAWWDRFSRAVLAHYKPVLAASVVLMGLLLAQLGHLKLWEPSPSLLPHELSSRQGYEALAKAGLAGELDAFYLVVHQPPGPRVLAPETVAVMHRAAVALEADSRVLRVDSLVSGRPGWDADRYAALYAQLDQPLLKPLLMPRLALGLREDPSGTYAVLRIVPAVGLSSPELRTLVLDLQARVLPGLAPPAGVRLDLGGNVPRRVDFTSEIYGKTPWVVGSAVFAVYALLLVYFRSLLLPLKAVAMNMLPVLGALAVLVLVLQDGVGARWLGIDEVPGAIMAMTPLMVFCLVFGLGMDYEVLILSRIREAHEAGLPDHEAIARGMASTSGVVTGAALIMLSVFTPNVFSALLNAKELGLGLTVAVLIDATIVRLLLVPTVMRGMGRWNWYFPGRPRARMPEARLEPGP